MRDTIIKSCLEKANRQGFEIAVKIEVSPNGKFCGHIWTRKHEIENYFFVTQEFDSIESVLTSIAEKINQSAL